MVYNEKVFKRQYPVVFFFVQHLGYYRGLKAAWDVQKYLSPFWGSTTDGHLRLATIAWCNAFGSRNSDMHWTKTTIGEISKEEQENFRERVLSKAGFTQEEWERYHRDMLAFRNKFVAHVESNHFKDPVPSFDPALQVAYAYDEWVRDLTRPGIFNQPTLISKYEEWKADASSVIMRFFSHSK
jgi:hypothetical protein